MLEEVHIKLLEYEGTIGQFAAIQEQILSTKKKKKKEVVDIGKVQEVFRDLMEERKKQEALQTHSISATVSPDRRYVQLVIRDEHL